MPDQPDQVSRTIVYIDGLNFFYGAVKGYPELKWVDFEKFARVLVPSDQLVLIRYFSAQVKPRYRGDRAGERQNAYLRAIRTNPIIQMELGHFRMDVKRRAIPPKHPTRTLFGPQMRPHPIMRGIWWDNRRRRVNDLTTVMVISPEEKGSDVNLGAWLVHDAVAHDQPLADKAIIVTNDSDLATPMRLARLGGVQIGLVNPQDRPTNSKLLAEATFEIPFRRDALTKCQLPNVIKMPNGKEVHRPKEWR